MTDETNGPLCTVPDASFVREEVGKRLRELRLLRRLLRLAEAVDHERQQLHSVKDRQAVPRA